MTKRVLTGYAIHVSLVKYERLEGSDCAHFTSVREMYQGDIAETEKDAVRRYEKVIASVGSRRAK